MISKMPKIGVGAIVLDQGKVLLGERIYAHGSGTWCPPGGHLEFGEDPAECAKRELFEETGLIAKTVITGPWTHDLFENEMKHYITLHMFVTEYEGVPIVTEPKKCRRWEWHSLEALPRPLFPSFKNLLNKTGGQLGT